VDNAVLVAVALSCSPVVDVVNQSRRTLVAAETESIRAMAKTTRNSGTWNRLVQFTTKNWKSLGSGGAIAMGGLWAAFIHFYPVADKNPSNPPAPSVVQNGTGIASGNNTIIHGPVTIGQPTVTPRRNPDALYQYGEIVAEVQGAVISQANGIMTFQFLRTAGKADSDRELEFRDWVLRCPNLPRPPPNTFVGQFSGVMSGGTCTIVRKMP
jgi:hypothetical protein